MAMNDFTRLLEDFLLKIFLWKEDAVRTPYRITGTPLSAFLNT